MKRRYSLRTGAPMTRNVAPSEVISLSEIFRIKTLGFTDIILNFKTLRELHNPHEPSLYFLVIEKIDERPSLLCGGKKRDRKLNHYRGSKSMTLERGTLGRVLDIPHEYTTSFDIEFFPDIVGYEMIKDYLDRLKEIDYIPEFPENRYAKFVEADKLGEQVIILGEHNPFDDIIRDMKDDKNIR